MCLRAVDVLSSLYPSYIFSLIVGFAPFKIKRRGSLVEIEYMKTYQVVTMLLYIMFFCLFLGVNISRVDHYRHQTPMQRLINFLYLVLVVGLLSVNVIFNKVHTTSLIELWKKLHHVDILIKNRGIKLDYNKLLYLTLLFCVFRASVHTCYILFLVCIQTYKNVIFSGTIYFGLNIALYGFVCVTCSFNAYFLVIGHMFEKVLKQAEDKMLKNVELDIEFKSKFILDTAALHQNLCEVARLASEVTSVQMLASFAATFGLVTLQIYSVVTAFNINKLDYNFVVSSLFSVVILIEGKVTLSLVSYHCMGMIPKTKELLSKILNLYIKEYKITREVNAFNLQILHEQFDIKAGSFFIIDPPIILTAGSAIITYIVLFIQTDPFVDLYQSMKDSVGAI